MLFVEQYACEASQREADDLERSLPLEVLMTGQQNLHLVCQLFPGAPLVLVKKKNYQEMSQMQILFLSNLLSKVTEKLS